MKLEQFVLSRPIVFDSLIFGLQRAGGISRFWGELLLGMDQKIISNQIVALVPKNSNVEWQKIKGTLKKIHIIERPKFRWGKTVLLGDSLRTSLLCMKIQPAIWHTSYYSPFPLGFKGAKIVSFYDMIHERMAKGDAFESKYKKASFKNCSKIVAISHHSKKDLEDIWPLFKDKTTVIPLCFSEEKKENTSTSQDSYFLFVGNRRWYKNFATPIRSILKEERFAHKKIIVVGGESPLNEEELSIKRDFNERIEFKGLVSSDEIGNLMRNAECLLYPSLYEGFGLPILEAFANKVPVLAYRTSSIPEVIGEDYPLGDVLHLHSLSNVLKRLLDERTKWVEYGTKRLEFFNREKMINSFIQLYEKYL